MLNRLFGQGLAPSIMPTLQEADIVELLNSALNIFHDDNTMPWNGGTVGAAYKVIPECSSVFAKMLIASPESKQHMLDVGVPETLMKVRPDLQSSVRNLQQMLS